MSQVNIPKFGMNTLHTRFLYTRECQGFILENIQKENGSNSTLWRMVLKQSFSPLPTFSLWAIALGKPRGSASQNIFEKYTSRQNSLEVLLLMLRKRVTELIYEKNEKPNEQSISETPNPFHVYLYTPWKFLMFSGGKEKYQEHETFDISSPGQI